ncbi:MAG: NAD(P)/FAD-dependent oxidoreductase [Calditrichaceae bacterium]
MVNKHNYIIVGQGLAGSLLAYSLRQAGKSVLIVDSFKPNSSSRVAAGLINPVTGRRMVKTWQSDTLLPFAEKTYLELEGYFKKPFFFKMNIARLFTHAEQKNDWEIKQTSAEYKNYVCSGPDPLNYKHIRAPLGFSEIRGSARVDVKMLLFLFTNDFIEKEQLLSEKFDYQDIKVTPEMIFWKKFSASKLIFCEGTGISNNPYFNRLPLSGTKGELLTVKIPALKSGRIIKHGIFIIPLGNQLFRVGATYNHEDKCESVTLQAREELIRKLKLILKTPFSIIDQQAGFRPVVIDRRPVIGLHPLFPSLGIFNGLGTKGVSLTPYFAANFTNNLIHGTPIHPEADINRFSFENKSPTPSENP